MQRAIAEAQSQGNFSKPLPILKEIRNPNPAQPRRRI
jgi:hypothetical protein